MKRHDQARYCRSCGTRLARDNRQAQCGPCRKKDCDLAVAPPDVPNDFWNVDLIRDALASWHMGKVIYAYRHHPFHGVRPLSQEVVAGWLHLRQTQLSRIESGPPPKDLDRLISWARILQIPPHLLWFQLPEQATNHRPALASPPTVSAMPPAVLPHPAMPVGAVNGFHDGSDLAAMQAFRAADRQVGGGHLYSTVIGYLQTTIAPRLFGVGNDQREVFAAAGALTEMAGWMAHDAGHTQAARHHFQRSLDLAELGDDAHLKAHIFASLSHLSLYLNEPDDAIHLARQGHTTLHSASPNPDLSARLLAMEARALSSVRRLDDSDKALLRAEKTLAIAPADEPSPWVSRFDEGSLASEMARCMRERVNLPEAERQARRILTLRSSSHARSRAFGQLILISVLIAQNEPEEACQHGEEVLDATESLGSYLVIEQLHELQVLLKPYRANKTVAAFLVRLGDTLRDRLTLYRWLTSHGPPGAHR